MLFSIIIPIYNVSRYIKKCLFSVCNQTFDKIECIIVNDATPDNSMSVVGEILADYHGNIVFKILNHEANRGLSAARNTGIKSATGDYIYFLDSDDELPIDTMMIFSSYLQKYGRTDFLIGNYKVLGNFVYKPLSSKPYLNTSEAIFSDYMEGKWYVMACGKLINRSFFLQKDMWFKEGLLHEDELFSFRLAILSSTMITVQEVVYCYYIRNSSIMRNKKYNNYLDHLYIISENIKLVRGELDISHNKSVARYFVTSLFGFIFSVMNGGRLVDMEKKRLLREARSQLKDLCVCPQMFSAKMFLEYFILNTHYYFVHFIMKNYYKYLLIKDPKYGH